MKSISLTIGLAVCCIVFSSTVAYGFPDICIPGTCNGILKDNGGVTKGTFSNWVGRADTTTSGQWEYDGAVSNDATGTYIFDPISISSTATYTGTASIPADPEPSDYTMQLSLTFPNGGYCEGTWSIDFTKPSWPDVNGTWHHTSRPVSPMTNHVNDICIENGIDYGEPDETEVEYEFYFEIGTDDTVNLVEVTTPGTPGIASGITFEIPNLANQWDDVNQIWTTYEYDPCESVYYWEYSKETSVPSDLNCYGDGWYEVTVFYDGGDSNNTKIWYSMPADTTPIPQPTQEPNITNFTNRQRLESPATFWWDACTDPNADSILLCLERPLTYNDVEFDFPVTATNSGPLDFNDGYWETCLSFERWEEVSHNADGIPYELAKYTESDYMFGFGVLAEITNDNIVNFEDFAKFAQGWLDQDCGDWNLYCDRADLNFDNEVNNDDLLIMSEDWLLSVE